MGLRNCAGAGAARDGVAAAGSASLGIKARARDPVRRAPRPAGHRHPRREELGHLLPDEAGVEYPPPSWRQHCRVSVSL